VGAWAPRHVGFPVSPRLLRIWRNPELTGFCRARWRTPLQRFIREKTTASGSRELSRMPVWVVLDPQLSSDVKSKDTRPILGHDSVIIIIIIIIILVLVHCYFREVAAADNTHKQWRSRTTYSWMLSFLPIIMHQQTTGLSYYSISTNYILHSFGRRCVMASSSCIHGIAIRLHH
jgi:hypothetical protein